MNGLEPPLDRLNYFNGQRLEAADLRLEQSYHMRVRRWLNKALHTSGIAAGLEVLVKNGDPHTVIVSSGLALDAQGREIILLEPREVQVMGIPSPTEGIVFGNYLTIQYDEEAVARVEDGCAVQIGGKDNAGRELAWGGPTRVRAEPIIEWRDTWPPESSGKIVLAQVELDAGCAVRDIRTGIRKYVGAAQPSRALAYALEGEKDIDSSNSKLIYFHIRGGRPDRVILYLRGAQFSTLYYTEIGQHNHTLSIQTSAGGSVNSHDHTLVLGQLTTSSVGSHRHEIWSEIDDPGNTGALETHTRHDPPSFQRITGAGGVKGGAGGTEVNPAGDHQHTISGSNITTAAAGGATAHSHTVTGATGNAGASSPARSGSAHTFVADLQILLDGTPYTDQIKAQLGWNRLGDGTSTHALVTSGTDAIQLDLLGADLNEGEHLIELKVNSGGGRVLYNLYVE